MENKYIISMSGSLGRSRGYGVDGYELAVTVSFDAKEFNRIKKTQCPLGAGMAQIKNVVLDAVGVRGTPGYAPISMHQRFPRAKNGKVTLTVYFDVSEYTALQLGMKKYDTFQSVSIDLNTKLEETRNDGHLFAKSALASHFGN